MRSIASLAILISCVGCGAEHEQQAPDAKQQRVFTLTDGEFVTYPPGEAKRGDTVVCRMGSKNIETTVPGRGVGVSKDPMFVATNQDGSVRAECGGIHAETAPPGSW